mmetsp:Transcript_36299/g.95095  ORF Transcript_36299/g.95095 Transcript_36299/m.95095 type:complete len:609 (+) Transcript_36299:317-2143(+)
MPLTLRIRTPTGQSRVKVEPDLPASKLFEQVGLLCKAKDAFKLSRNPDGTNEVRYRPGSEEVVASLGLKHGDMLYLHERKDPTMSTEAAAELEKVDVLLDVTDGLVHRKPDPALCKGCNDEKKCVNCLPLPPYDPAVLMACKPPVKKMSFHTYLRKLKDGADKGRMINLEEPRCTPLEHCSSCAGWPKALCSRCQPSALWLQVQEYRHVDYLQFSSNEAVQSFVGTWNKSGNQRYALMYGYYDKHDHVPLGIKAVVEAFYEPPQTGLADGFDLEDDPNFPRVDAVAKALGLRVVGAAYTDLVHAPELQPPNNLACTRYMSDDNTVFTALEVLHAATMQAKYGNVVSKKYSSSGMFGSKFVTCVFSGSLDNEIQPTAYMATDDTVALVRANVLAPSATSVNEVCVAESDDTRIVPDVLYTKQNEYGRNIKRRADPVLPSDFLFVQLPAALAKENMSKLFHPGRKPFPIENREMTTHEFQGIPALAAHFDQPGSIMSKFSDFHLLAFLAATDIVPFKDEIVKCAELVAAGDEKEFELWAASSSAFKTMVLLMEDGRAGGGPAVGGGMAAPVSPPAAHGQSSGDGSWQCRACTYINENGGSSCEMCGGPKS